MILKHPAHPDGIEPRIFYGGGKGGSKQSAPSETKTTSEPWEAQQPYVKTLFSEADRLREQGGPGYFPGDTLAPPSPYTGQAIDQMAQRAQAGSPVQAAGQQNALSTLQGDYLNPESNPYLKSTFDQGARQLESRMRGAWGGDDTMTGSSGLQQAALGTGLADLATQIYGGNYNQERGRQAAMVPLSSQLAQADYADIGQLAKAGQAERALGQQDINDQIQRYNYEQNLPYLNLQNYGNLIGGNLGGTSTSTGTQPVYGSPLGGPLGGAAVGGIGGGLFGASELGASMGLTGPWGAAGGAVLGGLLGK